MADRWRVMCARLGEPGSARELARTRRYPGAQHQLERHVDSAVAHWRNHGARVVVGPIGPAIVSVAVVEPEHYDLYWLEHAE